MWVHLSFGCSENCWTNINQQNELKPLPECSLPSNKNVLPKEQSQSKSTLNVSIFFPAGLIEAINLWTTRALLRHRHYSERAKGWWNWKENKNYILGQHLLDLLSLSISLYMLSRMFLDLIACRVCIRCTYNHI